MRVLVASASKHGATRAIAKRIAGTIGSAGHVVDVRDADDVDVTQPYDAYVIGSAVYTGRWRGEAVDLADRLKDAVAGKPVWLFSSGPLGEGPTDAEGNDLAQLGEPKELPDLLRTLAAREHRVFFGSLTPERLTLLERAMRSLPTGHDVLPEGDFRDWDDIDSWAHAIADELVGR